VAAVIDGQVDLGIVDLIQVAHREYAKYDKGLGISMVIAYVYGK
jgi:hypothetical protein